MSDATVWLGNGALLLLLGYCIWDARQRKRASEEVARAIRAIHEAQTAGQKAETPPEY